MGSHALICEGAPKALQIFVAFLRGDCIMGPKSLQAWATKDTNFDAIKIGGLRNSVTPFSWPLLSGNYKVEDNPDFSGKGGNETWQKATSAVK